MFWDGTRWVVEANRVARRRGDAGLQPLATLVVGVITAAAVLLQVVPFSSTRAGGPTLTVSPGSAAVGTKISLSGSAFPARASVQLEWDGSPAGMPRISVRGNGTFSTSLKVPQAAVGTHTLAAVALVTQKGAKAATIGSMLATASLTVAALATPTPTLSATATPAATPRPTTAPTATPSATDTPSSPTPATTPTPTVASTSAATIAPTAAPPTPAPTASSSFVVRCGVGLCLDGAPYRFTGLNIYNANSRSNCWYTLGSGSALDTSLAQIGTGQEAFRAWFFQRLATTNGVRDWAAFDHTLAVAQAHGERVIATLTNQWGDCENVSGSPVYKAESWYQTGYRSAVDPGMTATYRDWVREVVTRYRDNPTILAWQLINEGEAKTSATGSCSPTANDSVYAWAVDVAGLVKSLDPRHLVSLGTIGNGQCGTSTGTAYQDLHAISHIDLCEYHDYDAPTAVWPGDQWNGLATRLSQCTALGKPMFVGETGIRTIDVGSIAARAEDINAKWAGQLAGGIVGTLAWEWAASGQNTGDGYSINPNDPLLGVLASH